MFSFWFVFLLELQICNILNRFKIVAKIVKEIEMLTFVQSMNRTTSFSFMNKIVNIKS